MPTRASKRKAETQAAAIKPAAKRGGKGGGGKGGGAAAAAAGCGAAAATPSRKAGAAAAGSGPQLYAVRCQRQSKLTRWDDETFVDCYGDEDEGPTDEVNSCTEAWDGVWFHDAAYHKWQHPAVRGGSRHRVVTTDQSGQLTVFGSLEAANERAAAVFHDMLTYLPEWLRAAPPSSGRQGSSNAVFEEAEEDESEEEEKDEEDGSSGGRAAGRRSKRAGSSAAADKAAAEVDLQDLEQYRTILRDGRVRYKRELDYYCDPWNSVLKNRVTSWVQVEVVLVARRD